MINKAMKRGLLRVRNIKSSYNAAAEEEIEEVTQVPNLISSKLPNGKHAPVLDIDFRAFTIPSSTPGHNHLYLDKELTWPEYQLLLSTLKTVGIIEEGYYNMSMERGQTQVRPPWESK